MVRKGQLKKCPKCGKLFTCCDNDDCWCESYQVPQREVKMIWHSYNDCLCPDCLNEYAEK